VYDAFKSVYLLILVSWYLRILLFIKVVSGKHTCPGCCILQYMSLLSSVVRATIINFGPKLVNHLPRESLRFESVCLSVQNRSWPRPCLSRQFVNKRQAQFYQRRTTRKCCPHHARAMYCIPLVWNQLSVQIDWRLFA
jgi:hypothetical protein